VATIIILSAVLAPWIAPYNPYDPGSLNLMDGFTPPMEPNPFSGNVYWLGTDNQGRDVFRQFSTGRASRFSSASPLSCSP
jgi:peptide/nickel transport system permease protein